MYRSDDFLAAQSDASIVAAVDALFDSLYKSLDFKFYHKAATKILAALLLLLPRQFSRYLQDERPQKTTFGIKRSTIFKTTPSAKQRFLADFYHVLEHYPDSASSLTAVMLVGCVLSTFDASNPVATFTWRIFDSVQAELKQADAGDPSIGAPADPNLMVHLHRDLFAVSMTMDPVRVTKRIINLCSQTKRPSIERLEPVFGGLRRLIEIPSIAIDIFPYLQEVSPSVLRIVHKLAKKLARDGQTGDDDDDYSDSTEEEESNSSVIDLEEALRGKSDEPRSPVSTSRTKRLTRKVRELGGVSGSSLSPTMVASSARSVLSSTSLASSLSTEGLRKVLSDALDIYRVCPFVCYTVFVDFSHEFEFVTFEKRFLPFVTPIAALLVDKDATLAASAESFLLSFPLTAANSVPARSMVAYLASSIITDAIGKVSVLPSIDQPQRERLVKLIARFVGLVTTYCDMNDLVVSRGSGAVLRYHQAGSCDRIIKNFERAMFLGLFSDNLDTIRVSRRLLQAYVRILTSPYHYEWCFSRETLPLVNGILAGKLPTGRLAIRKKLRDHLCTIVEPAQTLLDVWNIMYSKISSSNNFEAIEEMVGEDYDPDSIPFAPSDDYGEYVASLGGIIMAPSFATDPRQPILQQKLTRFLDNSVVSLFSSDAKRREHCREVLCVSVHPLLCQLLLDLVEKHLPRFERALKRHQYNLCELYINVVRAICNAGGTGTVDSSASFDLFFHAAQLWNVNYRLLKLLNFVVSSAGFLRLKLKFCKLQVLFLSKIGELAMHGNILRKNEYARVAAKYLEDSFEGSAAVSTDSSTSSSEDSHSVSSSGSSSPVSSFAFGKVLSFDVKPSRPTLSPLERAELMELHLNIKVESSMMLRVVFHRLPLDTPSHSSKDDKLAAGVIFSNYFNMFVRILERMNGTEVGGTNPKKPDIPAEVSATSLRSQSIIHNVIQALVNLLSSNSEIGLKYSLPLGYHHDSLIRVSFINVFSKIIEDVYAPKTDARRQSLLKFSELLFSDKPGLLIASVDVCPRSDVNAFASALLQVTDDYRKCMSILACLLRSEISSVAHSVEILRSNTVTTRMVTLYSHTVAAEYLIQILHPPLQTLIDSGEFFEIEKVESLDESTRQHNVDLFMRYLKLVLDSITDSVALIPPVIRAISRAIFDAAASRFPQSKYTALGAYLFLRLYNPSIVSPDRAGIVDCEDTDFKRSAIQIARILQLIVNDTPPAGKFPLLQGREDTLSAMNRQIIEFMDEVINVEDPMAGSCDVVFNHNAGIVFFHSFFYDHWMEIRARYSRTMPMYDDTKEYKVECIKRVDSLLCVLGLPARVKGYQIPESIKSDKSEKGLQLYEFMSQASLKDVQIDDCLSVLVTRDGMPLIVLRLTEVPTAVTNDELVYLMIQTLSKYWEQPYCYLIDCTGYIEDTRFGPAFLRYCSMIPERFRANCSRAYFCNVSPQFYVCLKGYHYDSSGGVPPNTEFRFISSDDDSKSLLNAGLVSFTNKLTNDERVVFHDVSLYQSSAHRFVPVKLKVGNQYVQIFSGLPQRLKLGSKMRLVRTVDVYKISNLAEIAASNFTGVFNELSMVNSATGQRLVLASPKKVEIMRTLYFSRGRKHEGDVGEEEPEAEGASGVKTSTDVGMISANPSEAPIFSSLQLSLGQLLNISFAGLLYPADAIRNASFALLASLTRLFHFSVGRKIENVDGVTFPFGEVSYICSVSTQLARNHPQLTYPVLNGFFAAFDDAAPQSKASVVMYAAPWVQNIYKHVFLADRKKGPDRTAELVRRFVRASRNSVHVTQTFLYFIWSEISLEDKLVEVIIDEIVAAAIDHEAEGHGWAEITRYWPVAPTIEVCSFLLGRLRKKSYSLLVDESEIEVHTTWIETTVLARFLAYLVFDSLPFVEAFLGDIFYVVSIYMDSGPLELRKCMSKLIIRTLHSYLAREGLTEAQRSRIRDQIELLNGARFRMLFGLTREDSSELFTRTSSALAPGEVINRAGAVTALCDLLVGFLKEFCNADDYDSQLARWNGYVMTVAFDQKSQLRGQAVLILGSLTKEGISSALLARFLGLLHQTFGRFSAGSIEEAKKFIPLLTCVLHAFARALEGVKADSEFLPRFFWFAYSLLFFDNALFYYYGLQFMRTAVTKMGVHLRAVNTLRALSDKASANAAEAEAVSTASSSTPAPSTPPITIADYVSSYRDPILPALEACESLNGITFSIRSFDAIMVSLYAKGLAVPFCYTSSLETMEALLKVRYAEGIPGYSTYLFYMYILSSSNEELAEVLRRCDIPADSLEFTTKTGTKIPRVISQWYRMDDANSVSCCLSALKFFRSGKVNEMSSARALLLFGALQSARPDQVYGLWDEISGVLQGFIESSSTTYLLEMSLDVVSKMMASPECKNRERYQRDAWKTLENAKLTGLKELGFSNKDPFDTGISDEVFQERKKKYVYVNKVIDTLRELTEGSSDE
ncbi:DEKNAAC103594 [Brettanomyces naardenensis]|uniref:DEKNAAC103594 n=1 Tax=Brettanomyces naardenensis TaxID=13370 RepID=A0A448YN74_BRENA|nr:DEKNAAC103594 [Brettanomyces naardenensis]